MGVGEMQNGGGLKQRQKGRECGLLGGVPGPDGILLSEDSEGGNDVREVWDKLVIKVTKSQQSTDSADSLGGGQVAMAESMAGSIQIHPHPMIIPRNLISCFPNSHFNSLRVRWRSQKHWRMRQTLWSRSSRE